MFCAGFCLTLAAVCDCGLKSSFRLPLIPDCQLRHLGWWWWLCELWARWRGRRNKTNIFSQWQQNPGAVFSNVCDPNVSLVHGSSDWAQTERTDPDFSRAPVGQASPEQGQCSRLCRAGLAEGHGCGSSFPFHWWDPVPEDLLAWPESSTQWGGCRAPNPCEYILESFKKVLLITQYSKVLWASFSSIAVGFWFSKYCFAPSDSLFPPFLFRLGVMWDTQGAAASLGALRNSSREFCTVHKSQRTARGSSTYRTLKSAPWPEEPGLPGRKVPLEFVKPKRNYPELIEERSFANNFQRGTKIRKIWIVLKKHCCAVSLPCILLNFCKIISRDECNIEGQRWVFNQIFLVCFPSLPSSYKSLQL